MEPLPGINRVFSLVMQQERQIIGNNIESSKILVAAANTEDQRNSKNHENWKGQGQGRGKNRNQNNDKQCSYCHKLYHTIDECYAKHGYPPWYKTKGEKVVNNTIVEKDETVIKQHDQRPSKEGSIFSNEQMLQIMKMIKEAKGDVSHKVNNLMSDSTGEKVLIGKNRNITWILDTGATNHVTFDVSNFVVFRKIRPTCIKLPNGSHIFAHYDGTLQLFDNFFLHNGFLVPEFAFNLISVQKIVRSHNWKLIFSFELCQIQDARSLKMIGEVKLQEGLYLLQLSATKKIVNSFSSITEGHHDNSKIQDGGIWHKRLGHPSDKVLHLVSKRFPYIVFSETKPYDVCHFSRQTRLSFNNSSSYFEHVFDLIHVDIWGPYGTTSIHGHKFFLTIVDDHNKFC